MIDVISVCGLVLCVVILNKLLDNYSKEYTILISMCASIIVLIYLSSHIVSALDFLSELLSTLQNTQDIYSVLLKSLGICIVTNLSIDVCKDANQNALSSIVLMTGKMTILLLSIPLLQDLFYTLRQLINVN